MLDWESSWIQLIGLIKWILHKIGKTRILSFYAARCIKAEVNIFELKSKLEQYKRYELYQAKKDSKQRIHYKKWFINNDTADVSYEKGT